MFDPMVFADSLRVGLVFVEVDKGDGLCRALRDLALHDQIAIADEPVIVGLASFEFDSFVFHFIYLSFRSLT